MHFLFLFTCAVAQNVEGRNRYVSICVCQTMYNSSGIFCLLYNYFTLNKMCAIQTHRLHNSALITSRGSSRLLAVVLSFLKIIWLKAHVPNNFKLKMNTCHLESNHSLDTIINNSIYHKSQWLL